MRSILLAVLLLAVSASAICQHTFPTTRCGGHGTCASTELCTCDTGYCAVFDDTAAVSIGQTGQMQHFAVFAHSGVVVGAGVTLDGDLGISPSAGPLTGTAPTYGTGGGGVHYSDPLADGAYSDALTLVLPGATTIDTSWHDNSQFPDSLRFTESSAINGTVTIDFASSTWPEFVARFVSGTALSLEIADDTTLELPSGGSACRVHWYIDGTITVGSGVTWFGNLFATGNIVIGANTQITGRVVSIAGTVTLGAGVTVDARSCNSHVHTCQALSGSECSTLVDECELHLDNCEHMCNDTASGFDCTCYTGYTLSAADLSTCTLSVPAAAISLGTWIGLAAAALVVLVIGFMAYSKAPSQLARFVEMQTPAPAAAATSAQYEQI